MTLPLKTVEDAKPLFVPTKKRAGEWVLTPKGLVPADGC